MRMKKQIFILILFVFLLNPYYPIKGQENELIGYENKFITIGKATAIGQGQFILNGELTIDSNAVDQSSIFYHLTYSASISTFFQEGDVTVLENINDKTLSSPIGTGSILHEIWNIFSDDGNQAVYSIFHLTENEIIEGKTRILNFETSISAGESFYSPEMGYRISSYKIDINSEVDGKFTIYFDSTNFILIGFTMLYITEIDDVLFTLDFTTSIVSSTLALPEAGEILAAKIVNGFVVLLLIMIPIRWLYKKKKTKYIDVSAGLDDV